MIRYLAVKISYKGTAYCGFQVQKDQPTIAETFQDALERVLGTRYPIKGCSRTDSGVHANAYFISFPCESKIPCDRLVAALNVNLPRDIAVHQCKEVDSQFHARYSAKAKEYVYLIHNSEVKDPFRENLCLEYRYVLNEEVMNQAASYFVGKHDFSAFCSADTSVTDFVRTIYHCTVIRDHEDVKITIAGDGFLYNMVRIIVGTLLEVSRGKRSPEEIPQIIASRNRERAGSTAPAQGLYLNQVYYQDLDEMAKEGRKQWGS